MLEVYYDAESDRFGYDPRKCLDTDFEHARFCKEPHLDRRIDPQHCARAHQRHTVSVALAIDYETGEERTHHYACSEILADPSALFRVESLEALGPLFDAADRIIAYNGDYDLTLLEKEFGEERIAAWRLKLRDPMRAVDAALGMWPQLAHLVSLTLDGAEKGGTSASAPLLFHEHRYTELLAYCAHDVELLRRLYDEPTWFFLRRFYRRLYPEVVAVEVVERGERLACARVPTAATRAQQERATRFAYEHRLRQHTLIDHELAIRPAFEAYMRALRIAAVADDDEPSPSSIIPAVAEEAATMQSIVEARRAAKRKRS